VQTQEDGQGKWSIFLPMKHFALGKSRLLELSETHRISLIKCMANDVIQQLLQVPEVHTITVVGSDHRDLIKLPDHRVNSSIPYPSQSINIDVSSVLGEERKVAILLPDLPGLTHHEISIALNFANTRSTSFIRDYKGVGSTFYMCTQREKFNPKFGADSAKLHLETGAIEIVDSRFDGLRRDCDSLSDLAEFEVASLGRSTRLFMEQQMHK